MMADTGQDSLGGGGSGTTGSSGVVQNLFKKIGTTYQVWLDWSTPKTASRWLFTFVMVLSFLARIVLKQGWYIITYALAIYHLNLLLAFLTPKIDPAFEEDDLDEGELPTKQNEEFRPFIRRLPEFKFWYSATKATFVAFVCTFFSVFNIPVFWPILVMYFIILFCITMKRQIKHMIRYRYIPFTFGKPRFEKSEGGGVIPPK
uniref:Protein RER1 n=1 Tax=Caligus rogercresseyi TaxID=217165 RepID=C1BQS1_CALRO|nr:RER1 [Caligus rogercresseyi]|eukprot:TRINITY_DN1390_c0_g2_i1.p1 TRINITY_DN1390_c0_g2~~TRINITY_DN1390_c0_g2_i1.p1  ORF type:complete len:203 (+),score=47.39 TRINITY_DN1390_c0_g2_i1:119-727(+)